jgi:hypothetical protein
MSRKELYLCPLLVLLSLLIIGAACSPRKIQLHTVRLTNDDGTSPSPTITPAEIQIWVDTANDVYHSINYEFLFDPNEDIGDLSNSLLNKMPAENDLQGWEAYRILGDGLALWFVPDKAVIYFRGDHSGGFSWGPETEGDGGATAFASLGFYGITSYIKGAPNNGHMAHELGHYLGLVHTFPGLECKQMTPTIADADKGGMYAAADDDITDTNADPGADCAPTKSLNCPGGTVVVNGYTFDPPWRNIMSYHACVPFEFSYDQIKAINHTLEHPWRKPILR